MKIVEIIPKLDIGGAEVFVSSLSVELSKKHEVFLISFDKPSEEFIKKYNFNNLNLIFLNKRKGFDINLIFNLFIQLTRINPDIIHTHLHCLDYALFSSIFLRKVKFYHTIHNLAHTQGNIYTRLSRLPFLFFKRIKLISISKVIDESVKSTYYTNSNCIILNGSNDKSKEIVKDTSPFIIDIFNRKHNIKKDTNIFINLARITFQKNQINLIEAFKNKPNSVCILIGPIDENYLKKEELKDISKNLIVVGPKIDVTKYFTISNFLILPSLYEGLPIAILEAMSIGVIPVCTGVGGVLEVIENNTNGIIIKSPSIHDISSAITYSEELTEKERLNMSKKAIEDFNLKFSMVKCANNYLKLFNE